MRISKTWSILGLIAAASVLGSCGDNSVQCGEGTAVNADGFCVPTGEGPDAEPAPDSGPAPDGAPPDADTSATVAGTIAVTDTTVIDPAAVVVGGVRGGAIRISFGDLTMPGHHGGAIAYTDAGAPIGGCLVQRFDAAHQPNPRLDAGTITISAPATDPSALLKTVGPCSLQALLGDPDPYVCTSNFAPVATVSGVDQNVLAPGAGLVAYTLSTPASLNLGMTTPTAVSAAGRASNAVQITTTAPHGFVSGQFVTVTGMTPATFNTTGSPIQVTGASTFVYAQAGTTEAATAVGTASVPSGVIVGSALVVNGLAAAYNSGTSAAFPIIGQISANTVLVINPAPADASTQAPVTTATYSIINGFSPVPVAGAAANFLGRDGKVRIQKNANAVWPAIDEEVDVPGEAPAPVAITDLARSGNLVTATVAAGHGVTAGQRVTIAGTASPSIALTAAARVANLVTMTTSTAHGIPLGASVTIAGVTPTGATSFSGTFTVTAVTSTTFSYTQTAADDIGTGGTATTSFNGTFTVTATTATTFTYVNVAEDTTASTAGTYQKSSFALDTPSTNPSNFLQMFPRVAASALRFGCDNNTSGDLTDDTCGDDSSAALKAIIISGSATRRSVAGMFPFQMPAESSGSETPWLEWQCAYLASKTATMPAGAVQAILDFAPTRVEMQVLLVGGRILDGEDGNVGTAGLKLLVGHALAGHATFNRATGVDALGTNVTHACNDGIDNLDTTVAISNIARATNVVTVTAATPHRLAVGDTGVVIAGVTDASFNATVTVISVPSATTFTYDQINADASSSGGTASARDGLIDFGFDPGCGAIPDGPGTDTTEN